MTNQNLCEHKYPHCLKIATIQHYLPNSNFTQTGWTCVNCWKVICQRGINP